MTDHTIEPADSDDVPDLVECWVALADEQREYGSHLPPAENRTAVREYLQHHVVADRVLLARAGDDVHGFVQFRAETGPLVQDVSRWVIETLYVVPSARGAGLGSRLLVQAEEAIRARGGDVVSLDVLDGNDRARSFYADHDYAVHRRELEKSLGSDTH